jgi:hypothetical protein
MRFKGILCVPASAAESANGETCAGRGSIKKWCQFSFFAEENRTDTTDTLTLTTDTDTLTPLTRSGAGVPFRKHFIVGRRSDQFADFRFSQRNANRGAGRREPMQPCPYSRTGKNRR